MHDSLRQRTAHLWSSFPHRQQKLGAFLSTLHKLAEEFNLAVLITVPTHRTNSSHFEISEPSQCFHRPLSAVFSFSPTSLHTQLLLWLFAMSVSPTNPRIQFNLALPQNQVVADARSSAMFVANAQNVRIRIPFSGQLRREGNGTGVRGGAVLSLSLRYKTTAGA